MENKSRLTFFLRFALFMAFSAIVTGATFLASRMKTGRNYALTSKQDSSVQNPRRDIALSATQQMAPLPSSNRRMEVMSFQYVTNALEREHAGKVLTSEDEQQLFYQLRSLGLLAHTNPVVFQYLIDGSEPSFWAARRRWVSWRDNRSDDVLANYAILALGLTKRTNVIALLETLASREDMVHPPRTTLRGAIVSAVFYNQFRMAHDDNAVEKNILTGGHLQSELYQDWEQTPEGKRWTDWFKTELRRKDRW
jgi:hypothetical protein